MKSDEEGAATGDDFHEFRMGERCRDGEGVPKDFAKARDWFSKSAAHGNRNAAAALAGLPEK